MNKILVAGAGGFIGGHLVKHLKQRDPDAMIVAADIKPHDAWFQRQEGVWAVQADLRDLEPCRTLTKDCSIVYNLAADMGGMGFIENNKAKCMESVLINTHLLKAARDNDVEHYFYASSACVYAADKQSGKEVVYLKEEDAYPAMPEDGYGWEKLFSERMCRHYHEDFGLDVRVARFHNVYGPYGTYQGGREKAPAAICRKIIEAKASGEHVIEIWGDGTQLRSFMFIDDCLHGIDIICKAPFKVPVNLGTSETVTINQLVDVVEEIAGIKCSRKYQLDAPKGVNARSSDNTFIREVTGWEPSIPLRDGMRKTYEWIEKEMRGE